jgi:hypothetical protein
MRIYPIAFATVFVLAIALPSRAAENPHAARGNQNQPRKIWMNEDLDLLHSRGLISIVGQEPNVSATAPSEAVFPVYKSKLEDPAWYAQRAADLQAEFDQREAALRAQQAALANAASGVTQPGVAMDQPNAGVTPEAGLATLTAQVQEVQEQMDELSDLARRNNISAGVLRG